MEQFNGIYSINDEGAVRRNEGYKESFYKRMKQPALILKEYTSSKGRYVKIRYNGRPQKNFYVEDLLNSVCNTQ